MLAVFALVQLAVSVSAHTIFQQLYVDGVSPGQLTGIRVPGNNSPITDVDTPDMACNISPAASSDIINVPAGSTVTAEWHQVTDPSQHGTGDDPIASSHHGPVLTYVAKVDNATTAGAAGLSWVKIAEDGYSGSTWGVDKMVANKGKVDVKIPACLADGHYLFRQEIIALHSAYNYPGAQFYMSCAQIQITGGGSESPAGVSIPGAYKSSDPGVTISIYDNLTSYTIPGAQVFTCGSSGGTPAPAPPTPPTPGPPAPAPPAPAPPTPAPPTPAPPAPAPAGSVEKWGQCGGSTWTGATACVSGATCQVVNQYYSQCL